MAKIKLLTDIFDTEKKVNLEKGVVGDYGKERNERAVKNGYAEWVDTEKVDMKKKENDIIGKKDDVEFRISGKDLVDVMKKHTEKKEAEPKKEATVKGKKIEAK